MNKLKSPAIYFALTVACFYILPLLIKDTGSAMLILLIAEPLCCFVLSVLYGISNDKPLMYPLFVMVAFSPCIFLYFNTSAWVYIPAYGVISLVGALIGFIIKKKK